MSCLALSMLGRARLQLYCRTLFNREIRKHGAWRLCAVPVGATGKLAKAAAAGNRSCDIRFALIEAEKIGAVFATRANAVKFAPLGAFGLAATAQSGHVSGIMSKLTGQALLPLAARGAPRQRGSVAWISGLLTRQLLARGSATSVAS